jgi:mono/diheme cytochrome c family protein
VLIALSAGQKTGLGLVAAAFVAFALVSAFVIPRARPDFPGRGVKLFALVSLLFTAGMLAAIIALAKEPKEHEAAAGETTTATQPAAPPSAQPPPPAAAGDAAKGKTLFASNGCGSCHTFGPAGTSGKVGPDLDNLASDAKKAGQPLDDYVHESIVDPDAYVVPGFPKGTMPPFSSLSPEQVDDLVAFVTQS